MTDCVSVTTDNRAARFFGSAATGFGINTFPSLTIYESSILRATCKIVNKATYNLSHQQKQPCLIGEPVLHYGSHGSNLGQYNNPKDVKIAPTGEVCVLDSTNHRIVVCDPTGTPIISLKFDDIIDQWPTGFDIMPSTGHVYVADTMRHIVIVYASIHDNTIVGNFPNTIGQGLESVLSVAILDDNTIVVVNNVTRKLLLFDVNTCMLIRQIGTFTILHSIAVIPSDVTGSDPWIVASDSKRIQILTPMGVVVRILTTDATIGELGNEIWGLTYSKATREILATDPVNHRIIAWPLHTGPARVVYDMADSPLAVRKKNLLSGIVATDMGAIWICDYRDHCLTLLQ